MKPIIDRQQGIDPVVTGLVLGTPRPFELASKKIAKRFNVTNVQFQYRIFGLEAFRLRSDVKRGPSASIRSAKFETDRTTDKLERFTFAFESDSAEIANSIGIDVAATNYYMARAIVENATEYEFAAMITDSANYPVGHVVTIAGGSEWDAAGGDSLDDINTIAAAISTAARIPKAALSVYLPHESLEAALMDPIFLAQVQALQIPAPTIDNLRQYWGVKEVVTSNAAYADDTDALIGFYGDTAIVWYDQGPIVQEQAHGQYVFCTEFAWNDGYALEPIYEARETNWLFPWEMWVKYKITSPYVGGLILNTKA